MHSIFDVSALSCSFVLIALCTSDISYVIFCVMHLWLLTVMFEGREIFVGLSTRTNVQGAQAVGAAFPEYPTTIVHVNPPAIHLKDYITMAGPEVMAIGSSKGAQDTFRVGYTTRFELHLISKKNGNKSLLCFASFNKACNCKYSLILPVLIIFYGTRHCNYECSDACINTFNRNNILISCLQLNRNTVTDV